jgi:transcription termination factor Rho
MAVLERSELEASPLADLHAIANQVGLDGFRRLRKADLIDAILGDSPSTAEESSSAESDGESTTRRRRSPRVRRTKTVAADDQEIKDAEEETSASAAPRRSRTRGERGGSGSGRTRRDSEEDTESASDPKPRTRGTTGESRGGERASARKARAPRQDTEERSTEDRGGEDRSAEGVVELLGNGSAFLRVSPPEPSDEDVYISAAQVRRCELVSGDRVSGPVRTPRRSERYPSLARVDTINGASAESVSEGTRYDDLAVAYPKERLELDSEDPTLKAIEWLTPLGRGSRAVIVGAARSGKTETLRRLLGSLAGREGLEVTLVLAGVRPEEIAEWQNGSVAPTAAVSFAASADSQSQTVEHAVESAKRVAARGGDAVVLIDSLDGVHPHAARKALASARNLEDGGSLTVIATASRPFGGESTVISLDVALTSTGRLPALDLVGSGTVKPELLVGHDGAEAIEQARAAALSAA